MASFVYQPFSLLEDLQRDLARAIPRRGSAEETEQRTFVPNVDIQEDEKGYYVALDLPGVNPDEVDVTAHNGVLSVSGKREWEQGERKEFLRERWQGKFERRFTLPEFADSEKIEAKYNHGVLAIFLPKSAEAEPRRITVQ